jgi:hypothetical protein
MTIHDMNTRSFFRNRQRIADRSSRMELVKNADGSIDLYVGPRAPPGFEQNRAPSVPSQAWFASLRRYGPTEARFKRTRALPDFEEAQ